MRIVLVFLFVFCTLSSPLSINIFDVGQADSQLIVFPSGYSVLIDLGEVRDDPNPTNVLKVSEKIKQILNSTYIDVVVLSHEHSDHYGYVNKSGLWYLFEKLEFKTGKFIDRDFGSYEGEDRRNCNYDTFNFKVVGEFEQIAMDWACYADSMKDKTKLSSLRETAEVCSHTQINPPDTDCEVEIFTSNGFGAVRIDGLSVEANYLNDPLKPSENDYSIGIRVKYGDFVYVTSGDLDGGYAYSYGTTINNIETEIKNIVGSVDVYRANHHGSKHSSSWDYLNVLNPVVSIISCGEGNPYYHPAPTTAYRLHSVSETVYATEKCNTQVSYDNYFEMQDDIIITVESNSSKVFTVENGNKTYKKEFTIKSNKASRDVCVRPEVSDGSLSVFTLMILAVFFAL
ncbi:hypothetical protein EIN_309750 [Entamoeba invadens IP1]|uniref:Metallo-beta-lactamase domain-containing protein n=1 Tax=Entamoeba invadens IP1 TaxID=370355 RepID=A0A0A1TWC2_ENTIV|nr:hypothetical protein EIN_309750 [Entamoeba invadens IP1]ELP84962.1 hypothetical protein EIN_309750 [Entamoeba invadens IP1]|eukprot:XP_004184308.1 hypothetical protein EIN_309750 [Entamoeba invadens IP1]